MIPNNILDYLNCLDKQDPFKLLPTSKRALWIKARTDYEPLFSIPDGLRQDADRRFWIESFVTLEDNCDVEEDTGQVSTGVEIQLQMSHNLSFGQKIGHSRNTKGASTTL